MAEEPHPQVVEILERMEALPSLHELSTEAARAQYDELHAGREGEPVESVADRSVPGPDGEIPIRHYRVADEPRPVLVYYHGGGFVIGNRDTHDPICRALANAMGYHVVSVEYRLAPEHPFPAPMEDAYAATEWVADNADAVDGNGSLVVAGDSAGGNLAAGVALLARDYDGPEIARQLLVYPVVSAEFQEFESYEENGEGYLLETETREWFAERYLDSRLHARNEYRAQLLVGEYDGLPPATVLTAGFDPLRDEGNRYADRLAADGVDVAHREYGDMIHGFLGLLDMVDAAEEAIEWLASTVPDPDPDFGS